MRMDYSHGIKDHTTKTIEEISSLCAKVIRPSFELDAFLKDVVDLISKLFNISYLTIAVWDHKLGVYAYRAFAGFEKETAETYKRISYTKADVADEKTYPSYEISKQTRLYLSEEHPYAEGEESSYARPGLLGMKRRSLTDSLEGDYMCVYFSGQDNEVLGWIEASGTRLRKLPEATIIKWMELIACIVGSVILLKR